MERKDDFQARRQHLADLSDQELHQRFWDLLDQVVEPLAQLARTHTSPAIERSVLLRMGFSSIYLPVHIFRRKTTCRKNN